MTCEEFHELLHDYVGNDLVIESRTTVERHVAGCRHCGTLVHSYTHTIRVARALPKCGKLSPEFEAKLRALLEPDLKDK